LKKLSLLTVCFIISIMGGCWSQSIDSEAIAAGIDDSSAKERSAGNELVQNNAAQVPAQGGSSEYIGAFIRNDMGQQNTDEPTLPVSNDQMVKPLPRASPDAYQNRNEKTVDVSVENTDKTSIDQPVNQIFEEQPVVEQTVHNHIIKEEPVTLRVLNDQKQKTFPPDSSAVHYDYQNGNELAIEAPVKTTMKTIVDEPMYQPFEEQPIIRQSVPNQIYEEHPVHPVSQGDNLNLLREPCDTEASLAAKENIQVVETQKAGHDFGVVFEGRTYHTRVFDPNLNEYVYVGGDDLRPRGGLVM